MSDCTITDEQLSLMISLKIPLIIMQIIKELGVSADEAFEMFYGSETYALLSRKQSYYWGESTEFVAESFMRERAGLPIEEFENI